MDKEYILMTGQPLEGWEEWLMKSLQEMCNHDITGLALVALTDKSEDSAALTAYYNMGAVDKQMAADHIQADVVADIVKMNLRQWLQEMEEQDDESE